MAGRRQFLVHPGRLAALAAIALLCACVSPIKQQTPAPAAPVALPLPPISNTEQETLRSWVVQQDRLYRIAAPLLANNTELCKGNARNLLGFTAKNRYSYSADFADAARAMFGLEERLQVVDVLPGSGAAQAGLRRGDILLSAEDQPLPVGANAEHQAAIVLAPLVNKRKDIRLQILRAAKPVVVTVPLTHACGFGIELGNADQVSAYADGHRIMLTRGMLNFARSDEELAYVLAREMAHNILSHPFKQHSRYAAGSMMDNLIRMHPDKSSLSGTAGIRPLPQELDVAADKLAIYLVARGGYNVGNALDFWQRLAAQVPPSVSNGYTALHPSTVARMSAIDSAVTEVRRKQAEKKPLLP